MPVQAVAQSSSPFAPSGSLERKSRADGVKGPLVTRSSHGKHALDDEIDPEPETQAKKTRLEGERPIDGDADADADASCPTNHSDTQSSNRCLVQSFNRPVGTKNMIES